MSVALRKYLDDAEEEQKALLEVKEDITDTKADIAVGAMGKLLKQVKECFEEYIECANSAKYFDGDLGATLANAIMELSKIQATVNFNPMIRVDVTPMATVIAKQNEDILMFLEKFSTPQGEKNEGLYKLISSLIEKQTEFIERGLNKLTLSEDLKTLAQSIPKRITKWEFEGGREPNGRINITATAKE